MNAIEIRHVSKTFGTHTAVSDLTLDVPGGAIYGFILTEWYSKPGSGERLKLNVFILDRVLRADGVKVKAFKQTQNARGEWVDSSVAPSVASKLEDSAGIYGAAMLAMDRL